MSTVAISGGFDPIHVGHINLITHARQHGDVVVILNSDDWLMRKKGYIFMPFNDRANIISQIKGVINVYPVDDSDGTVCRALEKIRPAYFANGGDRTATNTPEVNTCLDYAITPLWNVGGGKVASSSELVRAVNA